MRVFVRQLMHAARLHLTAPVVLGGVALPRYYLDTAVSPSIIWLAAAVVVAIGAKAIMMLLTLRDNGHDTVARALLPYTYAANTTDEEPADGADANANANAGRADSIDALIRSIDDEVSEEPNEGGIPHVFEWCENLPAYSLLRARCAR